MILDNRKMRPFGSIMARVSLPGSPMALILYTQDPRGRRQLAALAPKDPNLAFFYVQDITRLKPIEEVSTRLSNAKITQTILENNKANQDSAVSIDYPKVDNVVLLGGGTIDTQQMKTVETLRSEGYKLVSTSKSLLLGPDYHVHCDPQVLDWWNEADTSKVNLYCSTNVSPKLVDREWKSIGWHTTNGYGIKYPGLPVHHSAESVAMDALQFVFGQFSARKIILLGFDHLPDMVGNVRFWAGLTFQAYCYWYSRSGKEIWNCTPGGTVAGCILGTIENAGRVIKS